MYQPAPPLEQSRTDLPAGLVSIVGKAMEKEPDERYQSMRELVIDLRRVIRQTGSREVLPERRRYGRLMAAGLAITAIAGAWVFLGLPHAGTPAGDVTYSQVTDLS